MSLLETLEVECPYCGERIELVVDTSVPEQVYVEDCSVCCQPMLVAVEVDEQGVAAVRVRPENA